MAGKTELAREIKRQGREGGPEEGWTEMEGTWRRMARGVTYASAVKSLRRRLSFTRVLCKTLEGVISTRFGGARLGN
jgi:hypothetical protein